MFKTYNLIHVPLYQFITDIILKKNTNYLTLVIRNADYDGNNFITVF